MMNHVTIMGRLCGAATIRMTQSGLPVANFRIAVERDYAAQGAERETDFIDCVAWRNTADFISKHFTKGQMIAIDGRLQTNSWTDREGHKRVSVEVVCENAYFAGFKRDDAPRSAVSQNAVPQDTPWSTTPQSGAYTAA